MTIYFRNLENISISGQEGQDIKKAITKAIEDSCRQDIQDNTKWIIIRPTGCQEEEEEVPALVININDIIAVR
jgi:hypothetical protein